MQSITTLAHASFQQPNPEPIDENRAAVKNLFLLLQGAYGSLFLTKYATGVVDDDNRDLGVRAALAVWRAQLAKYSPSVIEQAAMRLPDEHPDFPPNLTQFEAICRALTPRKTHAELNGYAMLPPPKLVRVEVDMEPVGDGKDNYRKIWARHLAGDQTLTKFSLTAAIQVLGAEAKAMKEARDANA